jgi:hypothetical protein
VARPRRIARATIKQRHAELSSEIRNIPADDRLRPSQLASGGGKSALLRVGDDDAKLTQGDRVEYGLSHKTMDDIE